MGQARSQGVLFAKQAGSLCFIPWAPGHPRYVGGEGTKISNLHFRKITLATYMEDGLEGVKETRRAIRDSYNYLGQRGCGPKPMLRPLPWGRICGDSK